MNEHRQIYNGIDLHGAGFLLFIRGGVISMLEGYTDDESWPASTDEFTLHQHQAA